MLELDVHLSLDEEVVVAHDDSIRRVTGKNGYISEMNYSGTKTFGVKTPNIHLQNLELPRKWVPNLPVGFHVSATDSNTKAYSSIDTTKYDCYFPRLEEVSNNKKNNKNRKAVISKKTLSSSRFSKPSRMWQSIWRSKTTTISSSKRHINLSKNMNVPIEPSGEAFKIQVLKFKNFEKKKKISFSPKKRIQNIQNIQNSHRKIVQQRPYDTPYLLFTKGCFIGKSEIFFKWNQIKKLIY